MNAAANSALELTHVYSLIEKGDLNKANSEFRNLSFPSSEEGARKALEQSLQTRLYAPFPNFVAAPYPKLNVHHGFARCISDIAREHVERENARGVKHRPVMVGIAGPAGAGKSTFIRGLMRGLRKHGLGSEEVWCWDQDAQFLPDYEKLPFSGHNPKARNWVEIKRQFDRFLDPEDGKPSRYKVVICESNGAFLDEELARRCDFRIGIYASPEALRARRRASKPNEDPRHFEEKTLPDILNYTYPSLQRHADFLMVTTFDDARRSHPGGKVFFNTNGFQEDRERRDRFLYHMNIDPTGWAVLWDRDRARFFEAPSPLCEVVCDEKFSGDRSVFEIGFGATARDARHFKSVGYRYTGVDVAGPAAASAAETLGLPVRSVAGLNKMHLDVISGTEQLLCGDTMDCLRILAKKGAKFSVVHAHSALHYLPPSLLEECLGLIRKICTRHLTIAVKTPEDRVFRMGNETIYEDARVYENGQKCDLRFGFTMDRLHEILRHNGYRILQYWSADENFDRKQAGTESYSPFLNIIADPE